MQKFLICFISLLCQFVFSPAQFDLDLVWALPSAQILFVPHRIYDFLPGCLQCTALAPIPNAESLAQTKLQI
jgi:hypothetical protein